MVYFIKIGGSVIAPYNRPEADLYRIDKIIDSLSIIKKFVLVHGAGGYGHPFAKEMLSSTEKKKYASLIWRNMQVLNTLVISAMRNYELNPRTIHYQNFLNTDDFLESIYFTYEQNFIPVTYGTLDVHLNVISGDVLMEWIAEYFSEYVNEKNIAIYTTDVDGVYDPITKKHISFMGLDDLESIIKDMGTYTLKSIDVTGGMKGKLMSIRRMLENGCIDEVYIVNGKHPERIRDILNGKTATCTKIT